MSVEENKRRPLKTRETRWAHELTLFFLERGVTPNQISVASMLFAIVAAVSFWGVACGASVYGQVGLVILGICGIQFRLLCNLIDGMVACESSQMSKTGEIYNDFPDRVSDVVILVSAGYFLVPSGLGGVAGPALGWAAALIAVLTAYVRILGLSVGTPCFFQGPMAKPHRMAILTVALLLYCFELFLALDFGSVGIALAIIVVGGVVTVLRRLRLIFEALR